MPQFNLQHVILFIPYPHPHEIVHVIFAIMYTVSAMNPYIANRVTVRAIFTRDVCSKSSLSLMGAKDLAIVPSNF